PVALHTGLELTVSEPTRQVGAARLLHEEVHRVLQTVQREIDAQRPVLPAHDPPAEGGRALRQGAHDLAPSPRRTGFGDGVRRGRRSPADTNDQAQRHQPSTRNFRLMAWSSSSTSPGGPPASGLPCPASRRRNRASTSSGARPPGPAGRSASSTSRCACTASSTPSISASRRRSSEKALPCAGAPRFSAPPP